MADEVDNPLLEHLRHIRSAVDETRLDVKELKTRVGFLENQYAHIFTRIDRIEDRRDRLERRLDLVSH